MNRQALPFHGIKVVDFGQYIAGPAVAMIFGDFGATVVHVDPLSGPLWDNPANATLNRNKLLVKLDLKSDEGRQQALALVAEADLVIENFRPGVMKRLGIDFTALRAARPDLITVSIPGFASDDELRRDWRAFEAVIAASSGVFTDMGLNRVLMGVNPSFSPLPLSSAYGTMIAVSAVAMALQARQGTGRGDHIEVPLASAVMEGLTYNSIKIEDYPLRYQTQREQEIERRRAAGLAMDVSYDDLQAFLDPFYRSYPCKDGRSFYVVCPSHKQHAKRCLKTLGIYDELIAEGLREEPDTYLPVDEWTSDVSLGVYPLPKYWADKITARMKGVFVTRTAAEWEKIFGEGQFPGAPHRWLKEWIGDEHAKAAGLMIEVDDPVYGRMTQPGPMAWLEESGEAMLTPSPRRDVAFPAALAALRDIEPTHPDPMPVPADKAGWLEGVRVLDLCNVIAGPHSVSYLSRFGADVIKIDPATPFFDCWNTVIFGMTHMRGKQSVLLDIGSADGRKVFEALVRSVDIIVWNATDRQVKSMGLDAEGLRSLNPDAIFCQLDCFGGVRRGPRTDYLGYDDLVQAATGIMLRFGGSMQTPEEHAHVGTIDVMCGFGAALAVAAALYQKRKSGKAGRARTSLSALSALAQMPFCYDYAGRAEFNEPSGPAARGYDALHQLYQAKDAWIVIAASRKDLTRFQHVAGLEMLPGLPSGEWERTLETVIPTVSAAIWIERFHAADIGASICNNIETIRASSTRSADGQPGIDRGTYSFSTYKDHPSGHVVTYLDPYGVRPADAKVFALPPAEKYGGSTRQILLALGYSETDIGQLFASGDVSESWSREYLPS